MFNESKIIKKAIKDATQNANPRLAIILTTGSFRGYFRGSCIPDPFLTFLSRCSRVITIFVMDEKYAVEIIKQNEEIVRIFKNYIKETFNSIYILVDNGIRRYSFSNDTWQSKVISQPIDYHGKAVNEAIRDNLIIFAVAENITSGQSLVHIDTTNRKHFYVMSAPKFAYSYTALDQFENWLRNSLDMTFTRIGDLTSREIIVFYIAINLEHDIESRIRNKIESKLKPSKLTIIGGNREFERPKFPFFKRNLAPQGLLVATLLFELKKSDAENFGPQYSFLKDFFE
jgi:hypothetical protein